MHFLRRHKFFFSKDDIRPYPCVPLVYFFLTGSLPFSLMLLADASRPTAMVTGFVLMAVGMILFPYRYRLWLLVIGGGALITGLHGYAPWRSYERLLPRDQVYCEITAIVTEDQIFQSDDLSLNSRPRYVEISLRQLRLSGSQEWRPCRGRILWLNPIEDLHHGMLLELSGTMLLPWQKSLPNTFDYRRYLLTKGYKHCFKSLEYLHVGENTGWRQSCIAWGLRVRTAILQRIIRHLDDQQGQNVVAAMTLGFRQQFTASERLTYLRSGLIHLFAVSGLNVGILFAILMGTLSLCGVPFSHRHFLAPPLLLLYVIITGSEASALRAWLMASVWSLGRGLKLPLAPLNSILFAALALLLYNPFYLFQSGFQFSFLVVICLVEGWRHGREIVAILDEHTGWRPSSLRQRYFAMNGARAQLNAAIASMLCAWLGGLGLTAYYNGLFLPFSIVTNLMVCGIAWAITVLGLLKFIVSWWFWHWPELFIAKLLNLPLGLLQWLARFSDHHGAVQAIPQPPVWLVLVFYFTLGYLLMANLNFRQRFIGVLVIGGLIGVFVKPIQMRPGEPVITLLVPRESIVPVIVIQPPRPLSDPLIINAGTAWFGRELADWLPTRGVDTLAALIILDNRADFYGGAERLFDRFPVRSVRLISHDWRNKAAFNALWERQYERGKWWQDSRDPINHVNFSLEKTIGRDEKLFRLTLAGFPDWQVSMIMSLKTNYGCNLIVSTRSGSTQSWNKGEWEFLYADRDRMIEFDPD